MTTTSLPSVAIAPFLASAEEVELARLSEPDFQGFLALVEKSSGEPVTAAGLAQAQFRVVDADLAAQDDLKLGDTVRSQGEVVTVRELLGSTLGADRTRLAHSLWRLDSFEQVKAWLTAMRAVVRFAHDIEGQLRGHILLAETIIPMVETVERKEYVLPNGDMASDAITRNLGIRAKVFALDRLRRVPRGVSDGNSIMDRLSRTLSSRGPR